ncbi:MAG: response regulator [Chloroflexia bacterium]|nr:response regulator [Chloroflexia bacterium]
MIECYTVPRWVDNKIGGRVWSFRDISQQKHAEQLLISKKKELDRAHRLALLGSWTYDLYSKEFRYSNSFSTLCEGLLVHKTINGLLSVIHLEDRQSVNLSLKRIIQEKNAKSKELRFRVLNKKGEVYYLKILLSKLQTKEDKTQYFWGITQDITQQTRLEQSLASAKEAAEDYNKAMDNIFSNISHEMRTPLNAILGYANILLDSASDEVQRDYFYSIKSSGESLLSLIEDMIDISKAEKENVEIKENRVNIRKLVNEIHKIFEQKFRNKGVGFSIEISKEIPAYIFIDEPRLKQILISLISNSLKFTEKGYVSVRFEGRATTYKNIHNLSVYVEDTGIGIAEKDQIKIFDSFQQIENTSKRNYEGVGLGLYITKRNVNLLGGTIKLHSVLNKGSVFILNFKNIKTYSGTQKYLWKDHLNIENLEFEKASILVADDHEFNKEILRHILLQYNFEIIEAVDGNEALLLAEKFNPALIIMDLKMPELDGYAALKKLMELPQTAKIPVIAFSSYEKGITRENLLQRGFSDF